MKDKFRGYYKPNEAEFTKLWDDSLIVPDANVLLNLYTYSTETWQEILNLMKELNDRIWLPYQAAAEYHRNRCGIIIKEASRYNGIASELKSLLNELNSRKRHPFINIELMQKFNDLATEIESELLSGKQAHSDFIRNDPICAKLTEIFDGRVGDPYGPEDLENIYKEGAKRYSKKIPPGYGDQKKPEPDRYGDLIIWKEIITKSTKTQTGIIFITDDLKEDWWLMAGEDKLGPRPELLEEFRMETGNEMYIYGSEMFVDTAKKRGKKISQRAIAELEAANLKRKERARFIAENLGIQNTLAAYKAHQQAIRETLKSPLAEIDRQQRAAIEAMQNSFGGYERFQSAFAEALRSPLVEIDRKQKAAIKAMQDSFGSYEASQRAIRETLKSIGVNTPIEDEGTPPGDEDTDTESSD